VPPKKRKIQSPLEKARLLLLGDRLKISCESAKRLVSHMTEDTAEILGIDDSALDLDFEFSGRELDLIFTINKQNKPSK
jgi:hypothetical protein